VCLKVCPQKAVRLNSSVNEVKAMVASGDTVVASLAPGLNAFFGLDDEKAMAERLVRLGFSTVEEIYPALHLLGREYSLLVGNVPEPVISTLCPSIVRLMEKYFPNRLANAVPFASPPVIHARLLRSRIYPGKGRELRVVHITSCASAKQEVNRPEYKGLIDAVLTVGEMNEWLAGQQDGNGDGTFSFRADSDLCDSLREKAEFFTGKRVRTNDLAQSLEFLELFPYNMRNLRVADLRACSEICPHSLLVGTAIRTYRPMLFATEMTLKDLAQTEVSFSRQFAPDPLKATLPAESEIRAILARIGINREEDEIDCGACGYNTCREKAVAVHQGMAEIEMCMPYMKRQAAHSYSILEHSPNAVVIVNHRGLIQFANPAFYRIFRCREESLLGKPVSEFLMCDIFERALSQGGAHAERFFIPELGLCCRAEIFPIEGEDLLGGVIVDISDEEASRQEFLRVKEETLNKAKEVIARQMCTAQEIASLLGETTADTKVLLVKLMKLFEQEERAQ
jgi:PAS domain-containing protein